MFTRRNFSLAAGMAAAVALSAGAMIAFSAGADEAPAVAIDAAAPQFTGVTSNAETISLDDFSGKTVVLEWTNHDCPFVKKHYAEPVKNMQTLQGDAAEDDIVWISVISSAPGEQGHVDAVKANELTTSRGAKPAHVILDPTGEIGKAYEAKTTPHMFIINADEDQTVAYKGAIDSVRSAKVKDIEGATNYVSAALASLEAGEPIAETSTKPYGCSVKYAK